jgi:flagellar hook-associated protein 2
MGSPVTFSGFNQIDWSSIMKLVMQQESQPLTTLQTQKKTLDTQNTTFGTLATKLGSVQSAADTLQDADSLAVLKATSSDTSVGVATTSGTVAGTYNVVVSRLARAQVLASTSTYSSVDDVVATGGALTITATGGSPVTVTLSGSTTLAQLADAINDTTDSPVTASVVQSSPGSYQLVLTGTETGDANAFTLTSTLTGGSGLTFTDTDTDGTYGDSDADNTQTALNALLTVNGLSVESTTNTADSVIPGVTLTLNDADAAKTVVVKVSKDVDGAKSLVKSFVDSYNSVLSFFTDQTTAATAGKASIARDPLVRGFRDAMRAALQDSYTDETTFGRLAAVGIGFDATGKLTLDDDAFETALDGSPADLQTLFAGSSGDGGAFGAINDLIDSYTGSGGLIADARTRLTSSARTMSDRIDVMQARLDIRRATLQREYAAADAAMTQLNGQGSALSSLQNQYRLF